MSSRTRTGHVAEPQAGLEVGRRNFLKLTGAGVAAGVVSAMEAPVSAQQTLAWDKTFPKSDRVEHRKVTFYNRLGITLVADLYVPQAIDRAQRHPALVVGGPYGAVKEQSSGLYAQTMAERGYITIAHDPSYVGESGGQPHGIASSEALVEDFSAGVDYLGGLSFVDRERIGVLGVCGSGGFGLAAAEIDPRIKAVATVSMYDIGQAQRQGLAATLDAAALRKTLDDVAAPALGRGGWGGAGDGDRNAPSAHRVVDGDRPGVLRLLSDPTRSASPRNDRVLAHEHCAHDAVLVVSASRLDLAAAGAVHHGRPGPLTHLQRARLRQRHRSRRNCSSFPARVTWISTTA